MKRTIHYSTVYNWQDMEATKGPSTEEWIKKMWCIYTLEYYSSIKKENNNATCSNMDGPSDYHTE